MRVKRKKKKLKWSSRNGKLPESRQSRSKPLLRLKIIIYFKWFKKIVFSYLEIICQLFLYFSKINYFKDFLDFLPAFLQFLDAFISFDHFSNALFECFFLNFPNWFFFLFRMSARPFGCNLIRRPNAGGKARIQFFPLEFSLKFGFCGRFFRKIYVSKF